MRPLTTLAPSSIAMLTVVIVIASSLPSPARAGTVARSYAAGKYALQLGNETSYVKSIDGGTVRGEVVTDPSGNKRIGQVVCDPIRAQLGADEFSQFIATALADPTKSPPVNGVIYALDFDGKPISRRDFTDAMLTEVAFPEFNAGSKDAASITIGLQPASSSAFKGGGVPPAIKGGMTKQKAWLPANYKMKLGEMPTERVRRIEAIKLTRGGGAADAVGEKRDYNKSPTNWNVPNIVFYTAAVDALPFEKWAEDTLARGNAGDEKTMTIDALDPSLKEVLFTLTCKGVGLVSVKPEPPPAGSDAIPTIRVELYAERLELTPGKGAAAAAGDTGGGSANTGAAGATPADVTASPAASISATPTAGATPVTTAPAPAPRKKRPPAVATAPTLELAPAPTLTPAPSEPVQKPVRKSPRG
jgi:hypothetical protein